MVTIKGQISKTDNARSRRPMNIKTDRKLAMIGIRSGATDLRWKAAGPKVMWPPEAGPPTVPEDCQVSGDQEDRKWLESTSSPRASSRS